MAAESIAVSRLYIIGGGYNCCQDRRFGVTLLSSKTLRTWEASVLLREKSENDSAKWTALIGFEHYFVFHSLSRCFVRKDTPNSNYY
jgi:hypothetical protein